MMSARDPGSLGILARSERRRLLAAGGDQGVRPVAVEGVTPAVNTGPAQPVAPPGRVVDPLAFLSWPVEELDGVGHDPDPGALLAVSGGPLVEAECADH